MVRFEVVSRGWVMLDKPKHVAVGVFCVSRWTPVGPIRREGCGHGSLVLHDQPSCQPYGHAVLLYLGLRL